MVICDTADLVAYGVRGERPRNKWRHGFAHLESPGWAISLEIPFKKTATTSHAHSQSTAYRITGSPSKVSTSPGALA